MDPILKAKNLEWKYALSDKKVLRGIDLGIKKGEFIGLIGPNGAGKTTLGKALTGLIPNEYNGEINGDVVVSGLNTKENTMAELSRKVGMVFSNPVAQITGARLTVEEEIAFGLEQLGIGREEMKRRVSNVLEWMKLKDAAERTPLQVSGGQKQKIALASLLVMQPDVLILDEPTSMLDPIGTRRVLNALEKLQKEEITTIFISHKLEKIAEFADRCMIMHDGKIKAEGEPRDILTKTIDGRFLLEKYDLEVLSITRLAKKLKEKGIWKGKLPALLDKTVKRLKKVGLR